MKCEDFVACSTWLLLSTWPLDPFWYICRNAGQVNLIHSTDTHFKHHCLKTANFRWCVDVSIWRTVDSQFKSLGEECNFIFHVCSGWPEKGSVFTHDHSRDLWRGRIVSTTVNWRLHRQLRSGEALHDLLLAVSVTCDAQWLSRVYNTALCCG